ncbi:hypothetical protein [Paludibacterium denitrificans]|uniref:hypothetical protein n=1 Tax=Paludibacterium denitrificans TaxID=2675226 RepID=UPI001E4D86F0|nr:hypothetical protein [Paludibacterium denitrificans]
MVIDFLRLAYTEDNLAQTWGNLIQSLIKARDVRQPDLPQHYKQAALERVLINYGNQPEELNQKLVALLQNWNAPAAERQPDPVETADENTVITASEAVNEALSPSALAIRGNAFWVSPSPTGWNHVWSVSPICKTHWKR